MIPLGGGWDEALAPLFSDERYLKIRLFLKQEYSTRVVYPDMYDLYNCFRYTPLADVKAVILGQDPYHEPGQAHGLCFSVKPGVEPPPSLKNIFKEMKSDLGIDEPADCGDLTKWAREGVLLLNSVLTVRAGQANSHKGKGWEQLTTAIIEKLNSSNHPIVFLLWGANAKEVGKIVDTTKHFVLTAPHPSPLSAYSGFFGCKHFSKTNEFLRSVGLEPIDWQIE